MKYLPIHRKKSVACWPRSDVKNSKRRNSTLPSGCLYAQIWVKNRQLRSWQNVFIHCNWTKTVTCLSWQWLVWSKQMVENGGLPIFEVVKTRLLGRSTWAFAQCTCASHPTCLLFATLLLSSSPTSCWPSVDLGCGSSTFLTPFLRWPDFVSRHMFCSKRSKYQHRYRECTGYTSEVWKPLECHIMSLCLVNHCRIQGSIESFGIANQWTGPWTK